MKSNRQWNLAIFKKRNIPIIWKRDFNITRKGLTIWGDLTKYEHGPIPEGKWKDSKLKLFHKQWYLILSIEIEIPNQKTTGTIIGVDVGQKNIYTAIEPNANKTLYVKSNQLNHRRFCIRKTRSKVASVGTRSARRLLQRLSGREKAVTQNMLHVASKRLVSFAESVDAKTIAMEDLTGIRKKKTCQKQRARNNRWPFAMCQFFVKYKAEEKGIGVEFVAPAYTSQSCPKCGHVSKSNRNGLSFRCVSCNWQDNADRNGAINIATRSLLQRQAVGERAIRQLAYSSVQPATNSQLNN